MKQKNKKSSFKTSILLFSLLLALAIQGFGQATTSDKLLQFAKIYGTVKYFSLHNNESEADWDDLLYSGIYLCLEESDDWEADMIDLFSPSMEIKFIDSSFQFEKSLPSSVYVRYYGIIEPSLSNKKIKRNKKKIDNYTGIYDIGAGKRIFLNFGERKYEAKIPFKHHSRTIGKYHNRNKDKVKYLATLIEMWNVFQHSYPYFKYDMLDWDNSLENTLTSISNYYDKDEIYHAIKIMFAKIEDSHIYVWKASSKRKEKYYFRPFLVEKINNVHIVTKSFHQKINQGDTIVKIEGKSIDSLWQKRYNIFPGTKQRKVFKANQLGIYSGEKSSMITLQRNQKEYKIETKNLVANPDLVSYESVQELNDSTTYIHIPTITVFQLKRIINQKGTNSYFVFDFRDPYWPPTSAAEKLLSYLTKEKIYSMGIKLAGNNFPNQKNMFFHRWVYKLKIKPARTQLNKSHVIIIIDNSIVSHLESILEIIKYYDLATIIGEQTMGTTGDVLEMEHNGVNFMLTEPIAERKENEQFMGIKPDIKVGFQDWYSKGYKSIVEYTVSLLERKGKMP